MLPGLIYSAVKVAVTHLSAAIEKCTSGFIGGMCLFCHVYVCFYGSVVLVVCIHIFI